MLHGCNTLEVLGCGLDVPLDGLLRQIDHVAGEERLAVELEIPLILIEHAVQPREQLLGAVIGVEDNRNAVGRGNTSDVVSSRDGSGNGSFLVAIGNTL